MTITIDRDSVSINEEVAESNMYDILELFCNLLIDSGSNEDEVCDTIIEMANRIKESRYGTKI